MSSTKVTDVPAPSLGAIYGRKSKIFIDGNYKFSSNSAVERGGEQTRSLEWLEAFFLVAVGVLSRSCRRSLS